MTIGSIRDISVQRVAEQARTAAERHFRLAFEDNMAPMVFTDLEDRIIAANDAFCQMVGRTRDEIIGSDSKPFTYPEDIGITEESHERIVPGEIDQVRYVKRYLHKDGRMIIAEVSKSPARDDVGNPSTSSSRRGHHRGARPGGPALPPGAARPVDGLANRALFEDRLAQAEARVLAPGRHARRAAAGPRRLQGRERHLRPPRGRRAC